MMDKKFRDEIDRALPAMGYGDRSTFIRDAVYKRLEELGIEIPIHLKTSPDRTGKGGRKKISVKIEQKGKKSTAIGSVENLSSTSGSSAQESAEEPKGQRGKKVKKK